MIAFCVECVNTSNAYLVLEYVHTHVITKCPRAIACIRRMSCIRTYASNYTRAGQLSAWRDITAKTYSLAQQQQMLAPRHRLPVDFIRMTKLYVRRIPSVGLLTPTGKSTVSDSQKASVPLVRQPDLCVTRRIGCRIRDDLQLKPAECRQIVHVYGRLIGGKVNSSIDRVVRRSQESDVGYVFRRERLAIRLPCSTQGHQARQHGE